MEPLLKQITDTMQSYANGNYAVQMEKYMKNRFAFYGFRATTRKLLLAELAPQIKVLQWPEIHQLVNLLWQQPKRECQYVGLYIAIKYARKMDATAINDYKQWLVTHSWWDTVDGIASNLVGPLAMKYPSEIKPVLEQWINDKNMWLNRAAIIYQLKYGIQTDTDFLEMAIVPHLANKEFFLQKAIGWSLRQYAKHNAKWVLDFVEQYELKGLALREATKHLR